MQCEWPLESNFNKENKSFVFAVRIKPRWPRLDFSDVGITRRQNIQRCLFVLVTTLWLHVHRSVALLLKFIELLPDEGKRIFTLCTLMATWYCAVHTVYMLLCLQIRKRSAWRLFPRESVDWGRCRFCLSWFLYFLFFCLLSTMPVSEEVAKSDNKKQKWKKSAVQNKLNMKKNVKIELICAVIVPPWQTSFPCKKQM